MAIEGKSRSNGAAVHIWKIYNSWNHKYVYNREAMRLECTDVNKALDLEGQNKGQGTKIHMWSTHGGTSQKWHLVRRVFVTNPETGKTMDVAGCSKSNDTKVHLWEPNQSAAQIWGWF